VSEIGEDRLGAAADDVYALLIEAHAGLTPEESHRLNIRLVLLLANAVGDKDRIRAAIAVARGERCHAPERTS
jgi:hypothetical protein